MICILENSHNLYYKVYETFFRRLKQNISSFASMNLGMLLMFKKEVK